MQPSTNFRRSFAMSARIFLPVALRRLSASSSEYPASFCDADQLLLIDHQPERRAEDLLEIGVIELHRLAAVLAVGVLVVPVLRHRARPVQRDHGGHVFEAGRAQRAQQRAHRRAFELEHAHRVGAATGRTSGVVEWDVVDVGPFTGRTLDEVECDLHDVEVAESEEVHLQQPEVFHAVHLVLRDHRRVFDGDCRARACAGSAGTR